MGWLNTLFDVANFSVEMYNLNQLHQLRNQGAAAQFIEAVLKELRARIFYYNQTAQNILEAEASEPRTAAGAMRVLELRLLDSGITPDLFQGVSLADMKAVDDTYRLIQTNSRRMCEQLSPEEQEALNRMAAQADNLPEYAYYLSQYGDYLKYLQAKSDYEGSTWMASKGTMAGVGCLLFGGALVIGMTVFARAAAMQWILLIGAVVLIFMIGGKARAVQNGKKTMEELAPKLDLEQLAKTHAQFQGNREAVQQAYDAAQAEVRAYFGSSALLPA